MTARDAVVYRWTLQAGLQGKTLGQDTTLRTALVPVTADCVQR